MGALEERLTRKQEKTNQILAILIEERVTIGERREKEEPVRRRRTTFTDDPPHEKVEEEWVRPKRDVPEPSDEGECSGGGKPIWRRRKFEIPTFCGKIQILGFERLRN